LRDSRNLDVPRTAACFRYFGGMADKLQGDVVPVETGFLNYLLREPVGVVGQVVPWNFPLMFTSWKLGPALAAGNTVVMKPSEITPLSSLRIAELIAEVGFPKGVVNIVPGYGADAGQRLAEHPGVGKISFTGSTATGRRIVEASKGNLKRVQLELGGKGANIVFEDADLDAAVGGAAWAIFHQDLILMAHAGRHLEMAAIAEQRRAPGAADERSHLPGERVPAGEGPADVGRARADRLVVVACLQVQRPAVGGADRRGVALAAANVGGIRGEGELPRRLFGRRGAPPAAFVGR
jgi:hypothetical protein